MELTALVIQQCSTTKICVAIWAQMRTFVSERSCGRSMFPCTIFPYTCATAGVCNVLTFFHKVQKVNKVYKLQFFMHHSEVGVGCQNDKQQQQIMLSPELFKTA
jgi:hypothetical protein